MLAGVNGPCRFYCSVSGAAVRQRPVLREAMYDVRLGSEPDRRVPQPGPVARSTRVR